MIGYMAPLKGPNLHSSLGFLIGITLFSPIVSLPFFVFLSFLLALLMLLVSLALGSANVLPYFSKKKKKKKLLGFFALPRPRVIGSLVHWVAPFFLYALSVYPLYCSVVGIIDYNL